LALGMAAEACSSTNAATTTTGDGGGGGSTNGCALLSACCMTLNPTVEAKSDCSNLIRVANNGNCASYLTEIQQTGDCTGTGTGTGTSGSTGTGTGTGSATATMGTGTGTATATSSTSCGTSPSLYTESSAGVYCPFSTIGSGGKAGKCAAGQTCCEPGTGTSTCGAVGSCATGDVSWECLEAIDCASSSAGKVCCATGTLGWQPACGSVGGYAFLSGTTGTVCSASCTSADLTVCEADSDCTAPMTCVASKSHGQSFGHCSSTGM
jgi:hypothetical protein